MEKYELAEFHKFKYKGQIYVYNVNQIKGYRINEPLAQQIDQLRQKAEFTQEDLAPELVDALHKLSLLRSKSAPKITKFKLPERTPVFGISLNVAQLCNLSCIYCYGVDGEYGEKGLMKEETAFTAIDWLIENSLDLPQVSITFFGGEPLLNFGLIKKVVEYAKKRCAEHNKEPFFNMTTNGTLLTDEINQFINENNFSVMVSFDGEPEMQNKNRPFKGGKGSYKIARERVRKFLKSRNGNAKARATVTGHNTDLKKVRQALIEVGFKTVDAIPVVLPESSVFPDGRQRKETTQSPGCVSTSCSSSGDLNPSSKNLSTSFAVKFVGELAKTAKILNQEESHIQETEYERMLKDLETLAEDTLKQIKNREHIYDRTILDVIKRLHNPTPKLYFCGGGRTYYGISISGDIYPCHRMVGQKDKVLGNLKNWDPSVQKPYIENYGMSHPKCRRCFARYQCGGGCFHDSLETNGSMAEPNHHYCQQMRKKLELAIAVTDQLDIFDKAHLNLHKTSG